MPRLLTSAEAADLLGVGPSTTKRWADAGVLACVHTAGGHRRFTRAAVDACHRRQGRHPQESVWSDWIDLLTQGRDVHAVIARLFDERARRGAWHCVAASMGELLAEVGRRWSQGDVTVVEEHIASAALQRALAAVAQSMPVAVGAPRCLLATAEGDDHTLGLSLAELCLREAGWLSEWVGGRTRSSDIVERVRHAPPDMVAISASAAMADSVRLRAQVRAVGAACRTAGIPLVLGGDGAWPAASARVRRFRTWDAFHHFLIRPT